MTFPNRFLLTRRFWGRALCLSTSAIHATIVYPVVAAVSEDHASEANDMIASVHFHMPTTGVIIYDLGLGQGSLAHFATLCNVTVRPFRRDLYGGQMWNLRWYMWKPLLVHTVVQEFGGAIYVDTSIRFNSSVFALEELRNGSYGIHALSPKNSGSISGFTTTACSTTLVFRGRTLPRQRLPREHPRFGLIDLWFETWSCASGYAVRWIWSAWLRLARKDGRVTSEPVLRPLHRLSSIRPERAQPCSLQNVPGQGRPRVSFATAAWPETGVHHPQGDLDLPAMSAQERARVYVSEQNYWRDTDWAAPATSVLLSRYIVYCCRPHSLFIIYEWFRDVWIDAQFVTSFYFPRSSTSWPGVFLIILSVLNESTDEPILFVFIFFCWLFCWEETQVESVMTELTDCCNFTNFRCVKISVVSVRFR